MVLKFYQKDLNKDERDNNFRLKGCTFFFRVDLASNNLP